MKMRLFAVFLVVFTVFQGVFAHPLGASAASVEPTYKLIVSAVGQGRVSRAPGTYKIPRGQTVTMTATPAAGWVFRTWSWPSNPDPSYSGWPDNPTSWVWSG